MIENRYLKKCAFHTRRTEQSPQHRDTSHEALLHYALCNTAGLTLEPVYQPPCSQRQYNLIQERCVHLHVQWQPYRNIRKYCMGLVDDRDNKRDSIGCCWHLTAARV